MLEVWSGLLVGSVASGLIPFVNAEILVVGVAVLVPSGATPVVALVAGLGQMIAKGLLYGLARWAPSRLPERAKRSLQRASDRVRARGGATSSVILASAVVGLPPFYGVSLVAGALRLSLGTFLFLGLVGRAIRFGALAWAARALGSSSAPHTSLGWTDWFFPGLGG